MEPAPVQGLAGQRFMFDYGGLAKFLLRFTHDGMVEVTNLVGEVYSITPTDNFPVEAREISPGTYWITWRNPADLTRLAHTADFVRQITSVEIVDDQLKETRRFVGAIVAA